MGSTKNRGKSLLREAPLLLGLIAALALLHDRGRTFVPLRSPAGFDWSEYLQAAWMVIHKTDIGYPAFRNPLYPWLLGTLGELFHSYPLASIWLASIGTCSIVLAAGLGARALSTPWAGGLAAISVPLIFDVPMASRWANLYPLLGGMTGLGIAAAAGAARWPRASLALAAGLTTGLAWGIDNRALPFVAVAGLLIGIAASGHPEKGGRWVLPLLFVLGAALGPISKHTLAIKPQLPLAEQVRLQRENDLRGIAGAGIVSIREACANEPPYGTPSLAAFRRPCARALFEHNLQTLPSKLPFGLMLTLCLTPLVWLPARRGWRGSLTGILVSGAALTPPAVLSLWVMVPDRYMLQFIALLAMLVPAAIARGLETLLPPRAAPYGSAVAILGMGWLLFSGIDHGRPSMPLEQDPRYRAMGDMLRHIRKTVADNDALLDCSAQGLETALLPAEHHARPANLTGIDAVRCMAWLEAPPASTGATWVVTGVRCPFEPPTPGSPEASDTRRCAACVPVPGPSLGVDCPHGRKVGQCYLCRNATVPTESWELTHWSYSGFTCLDTLMLWKWKEAP